jgi:uncharacterized protein
MKAREFNPSRLDVAKLARSGVVINGELDLTARPRVAEVQDNSAQHAPHKIDWTARAELRAQRGGAPQTWMQLKVRTELILQCQRCLEPMAVQVDIAPWFHLVGDEATAAELDAQIEDADVLAADGPLDLIHLIEDEILLSLPAVPLHEQCPRVVPMKYVAVPPGLPASALAAFEESAAAQATDEPAEHPFAALAALKIAPRKN